MFQLISVDSRGFCQVWTSSVMKGGLVEGDYQRQDQVVAEEDKVTRMYYDKTKQLVIFYIVSLVQTSYMLSMFFNVVSYSFSVIESAGTGKTAIAVSACRLHAKNGILVTAFTNGVFVLHEVPSFALIHNLR